MQITLQETKATRQPTRTTPSLPRLLLGERQDIVSLDPKGFITGYGTLTSAVGIVHYDAKGAPLHFTKSQPNGWTSLIAPDGRLLGQSVIRNGRALGYFDRNGDLIGEAVLTNETFIQYTDSSRRKIGTAVLEPSRVVYFDESGRCLGRKVCLEPIARKLALEDAWDIFVPRHAVTEQF